MESVSRWQRWHRWIGVQFFPISMGSGRSQNDLSTQAMDASLISVANIGSNYRRRDMACFYGHILKYLMTHSLS